MDHHIHVLCAYALLPCMVFYAFNTCIVIRQEPVSPPCPATADWPATPPGTGSHRACPPGQQGEVSTVQYSTVQYSTVQYSTVQVIMCY